MNRCWTTRAGEFATAPIQASSGKSTKLRRIFPVNTDHLAGTSGGRFAFRYVIDMFLARPISASCAFRADDLGPDKAMRKSLKTSKPLGVPQISTQPMDA